MWKLIIVEDELHVRSFLKKNIDWHTYGFEVIGEAGNGHQALELIKSHSPDLVLCDIVMPMMDGIEVLRQTREWGMDSYFVMLTCVNEFEFARDALEYGASQYILKLSMTVESLNELLIKVSRHLQQKADRDRRRLLYHNQPFYQLLWEVYTGNRELTSAIEEIDAGLGRAHSHVALFSVLHGADGYTAEQFMALGLIAPDRRVELHAFTALGHTTIFCWSSAKIEWMPLQAQELPYSAVYCESIASGLHPQVWRELLCELIEWRGGGHRGLKLVEAPVDRVMNMSLRPLPQKIVDRMESYLRLFNQTSSYTDHEEINKIIRYIHEYYQESISLKSMAQLVAMDEHYLSALFKRKTGENLIAYLNRIRIEQAQYLLINTDLSMQRIAERVGYVNDNYFIRTFKKLTNVTPAEYRKQHYARVQSF